MNKGELQLLWIDPRSRRAELIISADFEKAAKGTVRKLFKFYNVSCWLIVRSPRFEHLVQKCQSMPIKA
jgi:hypothetical protein